MLSHSELSQRTPQAVWKREEAWEWDLFEKVFPSNISKVVSEKVTPINFASVALVIFCRDRIDQKWKGDDIGVVLGVVTG